MSCDKFFAGVEFPHLQRNRHWRAHERNFIKTISHKFIKQWNNFDSCMTVMNSKKSHVRKGVTTITSVRIVLGATVGIALFHVSQIYSVFDGIEKVEHVRSAQPKSFDKIEAISVIGERNSGTRWTVSHLGKCFNHTLNVREALVRHKHWFQHDILKEKERVGTFVVSQFRDPYYVSLQFMFSS